MKTLMTILTLGTAGLFGIYAIQHSESEAHTPKAKTIEQQLAETVSPALLEKMNEDDLIIRFHVDADKQIARVNVKGKNPAVSAQLMQELKGKALTGKGVDTESTYEARFRLKTA